MTTLKQSPEAVRILAVDDEKSILDAYRQILCSGQEAAPDEDFVALRAKLFDQEDTGAQVADGGDIAFEVSYCGQAEEAVAKVAESLVDDAPYALILLDMRMPPGRDGEWAAHRIRELDSDVDIVIVTAFSDVDPRQLSAEIPPRDKIYYVQKPFHPHEIAQIAMALGTRWQTVRELSVKEKQNARLGRLVDSSSNEIHVFDLESKRCLLSNATACQQLGYNANEIELLTFSDFNENLSPQRVDEILEKIIGAGSGVASYRSVQIRKDGTKYPTAGNIHIAYDEDPPVAVAVIKDISDQQSAERQLYELAYYDAVTGLPNRRNFVEHCKRAIAAAKRNKTRIATLFIDLNDFKRINDSLGHSFGDLVLKRVGERLTSCLRENDVVGSGVGSDFSVARLGGDEYTILVNPIASSKDATAIAERIIGELNKPDEINGHEIVITPSVGIAIYPTDGDDVDDLLDCADTAMYQAKAEGTSNYEYFSSTMNKRVAERFSLEMGLRRCIECNELVLHYQPQIDLANGKVIGMEALVRWERPGIGLVPPMEFIPLAEDTGLITEIGEWVLHTACLQLKEWLARGFGPMHMAVNVSPIQFRYSGLVNSVAAAIESAGISPHALEVEMTETTIMQSADNSIEMLRSLADLGVSIAVDDFGIGYSSLSYLQRFPINVLKIDRSFVCELETNVDSRGIVHAIAAMGHSLNLRLVAEGVETQDQIGILKNYGIDRGQGFKFSRPLDARAMTRFLKNSGPEKLIGGLHAVG